MSTENAFAPHIRSFAARSRRLSLAQESVWLHTWPNYGVHLPLSWPALFKRAADRVLEIGFGQGEALFEQARLTPERDFIGVEIYRAGVMALLKRLWQHPLSNLRIIHADVVTVLAQIPENSLQQVQVFFPDPWPKKRHHKRRLIQVEFVRQISDKLVSGGILRLATDWQPYAEHMLAVLQQESSLQGGYSQSIRPVITKFERRGHLAGRPSWDLCFHKI